MGFYGYWVILTYLGVISAVCGIYLAFDGYVDYAILCLMISGVCDMFDGPVAKLKKNRTDREKGYGIQIDALADLVSFGVFPVIIGFALGIPFGEVFGIAIAAVYVLAALIRLAYFNVIELELHNKGQKRKFYEGLPVTSVALIMPLVYAICLAFNTSLSTISLVYSIMLIVISVAFITRIKIPKLRGRQLIIFVVIGLPIISYFVWRIISG